MKALVSPECINAWQHCLFPSTQAPKRRYMFIFDLKVRQRCWQNVRVVLRVSARPWDGANVDDKCRSRCPQQFYKFVNRTRRVSDSVEERPHWVASIHDPRRFGEFLLQDGYFLKMSGDVKQDFSHSEQQIGSISSDRRRKRDRHSVAILFDGRGRKVALSKPNRSRSLINS